MSNVPRLYKRDFNNTVASPTTTPKISKGRRRLPKSRNTADQNVKAELKLGNPVSPSLRRRRVAGAVTAKQGKKIPLNTGHAIVQHLVYSFVQNFLLEEEDGPVVGQHPWASTGGWIRICRGAEDGTRDALDGCHRHA